MITSRMKTILRTIDDRSLRALTEQELTLFENFIAGRQAYASSASTEAAARSWASAAVQDERLIRSGAVLGRRPAIAELFVRMLLRQVASDRAPSFSTGT